MKYLVALFGFLFGFLTADTSGAASTSDGDGKNTAAPTGEQPAGSQGGADQKTFTQADLDRIVQARLAEESARTTKKTEAERKKLEEESLAKNAEWQKLAEQRAAELEAIKPSADLATRLAERLNTQAETEIAGWPDEIKALDPGADNLDARLDWMEKARPLAARLSATPTPPSTQVGAGGSSGAKPPAPPAASAPKQPYRFQQPGDVSW